MTTRTRTTATQFQHANWTPDELFCSKGLGAEVEGSVEEVWALAFQSVRWGKRTIHPLIHLWARKQKQKKVRFQTVNGKDKIERYIAVVLKVTLAYAVELDKYGAEVAFDPTKHAARVLSHDAFHARFAPPADLLEQAELNRYVRLILNRWCC
jgi:hypothetical protein